MFKWNYERDSLCSDANGPFAAYHHALFRRFPVPKLPGTRFGQASLEARTKAFDGGATARPRLIACLRFFRSTHTS